MNQPLDLAPIAVTANRRIPLDPDYPGPPETKQEKTKTREKEEREREKKGHRGRTKKGILQGPAFINNWPGRNVFLARKVTYSE